MGEAAINSLLREALWVASLMAMPLLLTALIVGVVIGLVQALTSIQELTLTFVPKVGAMMVVFVLTTGFMASMVLGFFNNTVIPLIMG